jgi:L-iditol 2-dehydrogenase
VKVAVTVAPDDTRIERRPDPVCGPGEVVCRVLACATCGSDVGWYGRRKLPAVLGHEPAGEVVAAGAGVTAVAVGDRVAIHHHAPCGECRRCLHGHETLCERFRATALDPGGFAEYVRVPPANVRHATFRLPEHLTDEEASFVEPLACCARAVERAAVIPGDTAVVVGLGSIGCLFVQLLRRAGATVVGSDPLPARAKLAWALGARTSGPSDVAAAAAHALSEGRGADHVIITGGGADVLPWAVSIVREGGTVQFFAGGPGDSLPLPLGTLYHRELTITSTYSSSPAALGRAFWLLAAGKVEVDRLISHRLSLERLAEGVELMRRHEALKVFVTP